MGVVAQSAGRSGGGLRQGSVATYTREAAFHMQACLRQVFVSTLTVTPSQDLYYVPEPEPKLEREPKPEPEPHPHPGTTYTWGSA